MDFLNDLNEFMKEESAKQLNIQQDENNNYLINDRHQADYFINLSKQCDQDIEKIKEYIMEEKLRLMNQLEMFEQKEIESILRKKAYYDRALEDFTRRELENSNKKSIKLPNGTLAIKKQQPHYDYTDEALLAWATDFAPELVKTVYTEPKISVDKKELKKRIVIDNEKVYLNGVEVAGVCVTIKDDKFEVK
jgi:succinyl-CoA synthetase beta subunit